MPASPKAKGGLAAALAAAAALSIPLVAHFEGKRNDPYRDVIGKLTVCYGSTKDVQARHYTDAECEELLGKDWYTHAEGVVQCTPQIVDQPAILAASSSLSFNLGVAGYCQSTAASLFRRGSFHDGCVALGRFTGATFAKPQPNLKCRPNGKGKWICELPGLVKRRAKEVKLCLGGIQ